MKIIGIQDVVFLSITCVFYWNHNNWHQRMQKPNEAKRQSNWSLLRIIVITRGLEPRSKNSGFLHDRRSWPYYLQIQFNRETLWKLFSYFKEYCSVWCLFSTLLHLMISEIYDAILVRLWKLLINSTDISHTGTVQ